MALCSGAWANKVPHGREFTFKSGKAGHEKSRELHFNGALLGSVGEDRIFRQAPEIPFRRVKYLPVNDNQDHFLLDLESGDIARLITTKDSSHQSVLHMKKREDGKKDLHRDGRLEGYVTADGDVYFNNFDGPFIDTIFSQKANGSFGIVLPTENVAANVTFVNGKPKRITVRNPRSREDELSVKIEGSKAYADVGTMNRLARKGRRQLPSSVTSEMYRFINEIQGAMPYLNGVRKMIEEFDQLSTSDW